MWLAILTAENKDLLLYIVENNIPQSGKFISFIEKVTAQFNKLNYNLIFPVMLGQFFTSLIHGNCLHALSKARF